MVYNVTIKYIYSLCTLCTINQAADAEEELLLLFYVCTSSRKSIKMQPTDDIQLSYYYIK